MKDHLNWIKDMWGDGADTPAEENADVLRRMTEDGDDLTQPRDIDFNHIFSSEEEAIAFEEAVRSAGHPRVDHDFWHEHNGWLTSVHIRMVPKLEEITAMELSLNEIAVTLNGNPDGWGCMEIVPTPAS